MVANWVASSDVPFSGLAAGVQADVSSDGTSAGRLGRRVNGMPLSGLSAGGQVDVSSDGTSDGMSAGRLDRRVNGVLVLSALPNEPRRIAREAESSGKLADDDDDDGTAMWSGELALGDWVRDLRDRRVSGGSRAVKPSELARGTLSCVSESTTLEAVSNGESRELKDEPAGATRRFGVVIDDVESVVGGWSAQAKVP